MNDRHAPSSAVLPLTALVAGALALGSSPILARMSELAPTATAFHRVALAVPALFLLPYVLPLAAEGSAAGLPDRKSLVVLGLAGVLFAVDLACLHWSLRTTTVANSTLLLNSAPFFVGLIGWVLYRKPLQARFLLSLVLAFAGVALLVGRPSAIGQSQMLGNGLALLAGASYGGYLVAVSRVREHIATGPVMTISSLACALCLLPLAIASGESLLPQTRDGWLVLLALALLTHTAGQGLVAYALKALPAATSSAVLLLQPVVAAILAWQLFGEGLAPLQILGGGIVLAGVYLCQQAVREAEPA